jgi:tetratricopeptide (TPR) repeat protein
MRSLWLILLVALLVSGCPKAPPGPDTAPPVVPPPAPQKPPPPPPPPPPPRVPTEQEKAAAQERAIQAAELLQDGKVAETRLELQRALKLDPHNVLATTLQRQLDEDPTAILGKEFFLYKVISGDTLSRIADRFLGDKYMFFALARYNNIAVPRQLQAGQTIKILGKPPKEQPKPPPPPPNQNIPPSPPPGPSIEAAVRACDNAEKMYRASEQMRAAGRTDKQLENLDRAHEFYRECGRLGGQNPEIAAKREQIKRSLADSYYREAMKAYYNQDLDLAIQLLRRVLEVDPEHRLAADNLQKALYLKSKVPK